LLAGFIGVTSGALLRISTPDILFNFAKINQNLLLAVILLITTILIAFMLLIRQIYLIHQKRMKIKKYMQSSEFCIPK